MFEQLAIDATMKAGMAVRARALLTERLAARLGDRFAAERLAAFDGGATRERSIAAA